MARFKQALLFFVPHERRRYRAGQRTGAGSSVAGDAAVIDRPAIRLLVLLLVTATAGPALAQDDDRNAIDDTPHVTIVGVAEQDVVPDLATISLGVATAKPSARAASDANAATAQAIIAEAKAAGVPAADITTTSITLTQTFEDTHDSSGRFIERKPSGYEATEMLSIRMRDFAKVGVLAQELVEKGANRFDGIAFSVEKPEPILDRLTARAVETARRRAQIATDAAGVRLGRVVLIEKPSAAERSIGGPAMKMRVASAAVPVEAGTQTLAVEMEVTWAIEPR